MELIKTYHISTGTLDALRKNKSVTMNASTYLCYFRLSYRTVVKIEKVINKKQLVAKFFIAKSAVFNYHIKFCQTVSIYI